MVKLVDETAIQPVRLGTGSTVPLNSNAGAGGVGMQKVGAGIEKIGEAAQSIKAKIESDETDAEKWQQNAKLIEFEAAQRKRLEDAQRAHEGDPNGYGPARVKEYDEAAKAFQSQVPERLRDWSYNRLVQLRGTIDTAASRFEATRRDEFFGNTATKTLDELRRQIDADPARYQELREKGAEVIRTAPISAEAKRQMEEKWRSGAPTALITSEMRTNPARVRAGMGVGTQNENEAALMQKFMASGFSKEQASGIVGNLIQESSLNTGARNPGDGRDGTDSIGIGQWNSDRAAALRRFAESKGKPVTDLNVQADFILHELNTSESAAMRRLKAAKTPQEAAAAFIGFERPQGWTEENPTAGHGWNERLRHANRLAGVPDARYEGISYEQRVRFAAVAEREQERLARAERSNQRVEQESVKNLIADDLASIQNTGKPVQELTQERVAAAYGPERAAQWARQRESAATVYETTSEFPRMTNEEIGAALAKVKPKGGGQGFAVEQQTYDAIDKAAKKVLKEREDDPAMSVSRTKPVEDAVSAFRSGGATPQNWQALATARMTAQAAIGIPEAGRSPITVAEAKRIMLPVTEAQEGDQIKALRQVAETIDKLFGEKWGAVAFAAAVNSVSVDKETARAAAPILRKLMSGQRVPRDEMAAFEAAMQDQTLYRAVAPLASVRPYGVTPGNMGSTDNGMQGRPPAPAQTRVIPPSAIAELRRNPGNIGAFLQKYGKDEYGRGAAVKAAETLGVKVPKEMRAQ